MTPPKSNNVPKRSSSIIILPTDSLNRFQALFNTSPQTFLVGGWPTPLKKKVSWDYYMEIQKKIMFQTTVARFWCLLKLIKSPLSLLPVPSSFIPISSVQRLNLHSLGSPTSMSCCPFNAAGFTLELSGSPGDAFGDPKNMFKLCICTSRVNKRGRLKITRKTNPGKSNHLWFNPLEVVHSVNGRTCTETCSISFVIFQVKTQP